MQPAEASLLSRNIKHGKSVLKLPKQTSINLQLSCMMIKNNVGMETVFWYETAFFSSDFFSHHSLDFPFKYLSKCLETVPCILVVSLG